MSSSARHRNRRGRWFVRMLRLAGKLPLPLVHAAGAVFGRLSGWLSGRARDTVETNLRLCFPDVDARGRARLARRAHRETGKAALEAGFLWHGDADVVLGKVRGVEGEALLRAALAGGRGVLLALPHLGSWEMVGLHVSQAHPMTSLYRPPLSPALDPVMRAGRGRFGNRLVPTDAGGVRALYQALGRGEIVAVLPDQVPAPGSGVLAPFFGIEVPTAVLLARLAQRTGAAVLFAYAERLPRGAGFRLHYGPLLTDLGALLPQAAAARVNACVETLVRACPEQYQWTYRRFRGREAEGIRHYPQR